MTDNQAKVREADDRVYASPCNCCGNAKRHNQSCSVMRERRAEALALLAEDKPSVPIALIERLRYQGIHTREQIIKMFADFGYVVKE